MTFPYVLQDCLFRLRSSTQKGGTLICEEVTDLAAHEKRLSKSSGYRPKSCPCGGQKLHVHDYRFRTPRAESGKLPEIRIVRYRCVACEARWQILPLFLARYLWRTWDVVQRTLMPQPSPPNQPATAHKAQIPRRTMQRWQERWQRMALPLAQVLAAAGQAWSELATSLPQEARCADLVTAYGRKYGADQPMAELAVLLYRLQPNIRLA